MNSKTLSEQIKHTRESLNLSQRELAKRLEKLESANQLKSEETKSQHPYKVGDWVKVLDSTDIMFLDVKKHWEDCKGNFYLLDDENYGDFRVLKIREIDLSDNTVELNAINQIDPSGTVTKIDTRFEQPAETINEFSSTEKMKNLESY